MTKIRSLFIKWHRYSPVFTMVTALLVPFTLVMHILAICIPAVSDFVNRYPAAGVRFLLAKLTGILPFARAEVVILLVIPLAVGGFFLARRLEKREDPKGAYYFLSYLLGFLCLMYTLFVFTLGTAYFGTPMDEELGLDREKVSAEELYETAEAILERIDSVIDEIEFDENGASVMPMTRKELNRELNTLAKKAAEKYPFLSSLSSRVKPILLSKPMTYTHMSGIYTYLTGEANINTNFPDSTIPFTMAHEMSHQRGIAREDEANFAALLISMESDDPYILYSAYYELFKYFINALAVADTELFEAIYKKADSRLVGEIYAFNDFFDKYADNLAADITGGLNDAYQQIQGVEEGIASYGLVVDLAVAYYKANGRI